MTAKAPTRPDESGSSNKLFIGALVGIFVIGAAIVAVLASNRETNAAASGIPLEDGVEVAADVTIEGDALPALATSGVSTAATDPTIGTVAPTLTGTDFSGETVTIGPDGRSKVIMFLAHWCPHCQAEVPQVMGLVEEGKLPESVDIYAVSTGINPEGGNYPPNRWLAREGWTFPIIRDSVDSQALTAFGGASFPYVVYLDGDNTVVARSAGQLSEAQTESQWLELAGG